MTEKHKNEVCYEDNNFPVIEVDFEEEQEDAEVNVKCALYDKNSKYLISDIAELLALFD